MESNMDFEVGNILCHQPDNSLLVLTKSVFILLVFEEQRNNLMSRKYSVQQILPFTQNAKWSNKLCEENASM